MEFLAEQDNSFLESIKKLSGQSIDLCFQCQKCASGCTMAGDAQYAPNQIIRMIQLGLKEQVLQSDSIWLCTGCETCGARCPNDIDSGEVMDALKETAVKEQNINQPKIYAFNKIFLDYVKNTGRINEGMMMAKYKMKFKDFSDMDYGRMMFFKGKINPFSKKIKNRERIKRIFAETLEK